MSDSCCSLGCAAPPASQSPRYRRVLWAAPFITVLLLDIELGAGLQAGSLALLADAVDFFSDAANYGLSLLVLGMALTWRARAALLKGVTMVAFGVFVLGRAVLSASPGTVPAPVTMGAIGALALLGAALGVFGIGIAWPDPAVAVVMGMLALSAARAVVEQARAELRLLPAHA